MNMELNKKKVQSSFNRAANTYNDHNIIQQEIAERLLDRLFAIKLQPQVILDCAARTGYVSHRLSQLYPQAQIIAVDYAEQMLQLGLSRQQITNPLCADPLLLPFMPQSADLIIANLALHWVEDYSSCLQGWQQILKPNGLLLFTTLGPDTLYELRESFATVSPADHVHTFVDMHHFGDVLLAQHWRDPVIDKENISINYHSVAGLIQDLKMTGVTNALLKRSRGLMSRKCWHGMLQHYQQFSNDNQRLPATYEVIYGHAWNLSASLREGEAVQEFLIPLQNITRK